MKYREIGTPIQERIGAKIGTSSMEGSLVKHIKILSAYAF